MVRSLLVGGLVALGALTAGCGSKECKLDDPGSCPGDMTCEPVQGREKPMCFPPVQLEGKVFDLATGSGIEKAEVTALDANGAPVGAFAVSGAGGAYTLKVPSTRTDEKGAFVPKKLTLRASAANYATFPSGVRVSLPIDTAAAARTDENKPFVLKGGLSDIGLSPLPDGERGWPSISGTVQVSADQKGVLVIAETGGNTGISAVADRDGAFHIFNVAPGSYQVRAYSRGYNYTPVEVSLDAGQDKKDVKLLKSEAPTATLSGRIDLVAGANLAGTSVVMVVESTFNTALVRGEVPPGLRAPELGEPPNLGTGPYSISGVPDGKYVVLAAFENDGNVRDPDPNIAGTQIQHLEVQNGVASLEPSFKVTGAMQIVSPGGGDALDEVSGTPSFSWKPYSSARSYEIEVFDALGTLVWEKRDVSDVKDASGNIVVPYGGPALVSGRIYQFRAYAKGNLGNRISLTEDLRGLFLYK